MGLAVLFGFINVKFLKLLHSIGLMLIAEMHRGLFLVITYFNLVFSILVLGLTVGKILKTKRIKKFKISLLLVKIKGRYWIRLLAEYSG